MKKLILLLLIVFTSSYSQNIKITDFEKKENGNLVINKKSFQYKNGDDKLVDVSVTILTDNEKINLIGIDKLNSMLEESNLRTSISLKNKNTYIPKRITAYYSDNNKAWSINVEFIGKNDFGVEKEAKTYFIFDSKGEFVKTL